MISGKNLYAHFKAGNGAEASAIIKKIMGSTLVEPKLMYSPLALNQYTLDFEKIASLLLHDFPVRYRQMGGEYIAEFIIEGRKEYYNLNQILRFCNRQHVSMKGPDIESYEKRAASAHPGSASFFTNMHAPSKEEMYSLASKELQPLTYAELLALRNWTTEYYTSINNVLRGKFDGMNDREITRAIMHTAMALSGFNKAPKKRLDGRKEDENEKRFVFRWEKAENEEQLAKLKQRILNLRETENVITEPCIAGSSFDFPEKHFKGNVAILFDGEYSGVDVRSISEAPDERECVILPSQIKITGYAKHGNIHYFIARIVNTPANTPKEASTLAKNIHQNDLMRAQFGMQQMLRKFIALENEAGFHQFLSKSQRLKEAYIHLADLAKNLLHDAVMGPSKKLAAIQAEIDVIKKILSNLVKEDKNLLEHRGIIESKFDKILNEHMDKKSLAEIEDMDSAVKEKHSKKQSESKEAPKKNETSQDEHLKTVVNQLNGFIGTPQRLGIEEIKAKMPANSMLIAQKGTGFVLLHKENVHCRELPIIISAGKLKLAHIEVDIEDLFGIDDAMREFAQKNNSQFIDFSEFRDKDPSSSIGDKNVQPLIKAVAGNKPNNIIKLLLLGASLDDVDGNGNSILMRALNSKSINDAGKQLLEICTEQQLLQRNKFGDNLLKVMVENGNKDLLPLIENKFGKDFLKKFINDKNKAGETALSFAISRGNKDMIARLISYGGDINLVMLKQFNRIKNEMLNLPKNVIKYYNKLEKDFTASEDKSFPNAEFLAFGKSIKEIINNSNISNTKILAAVFNTLENLQNSLINKYPKHSAKIKDSIGSLKFPFNLMMSDTENIDRFSLMLEESQKSQNSQKLQYSQESKQEFVPEFEDIKVWQALVQEVRKEQEQEREQFQFNLPWLANIQIPIIFSETDKPKKAAVEDMAKKPEDSANNKRKQPEDPSQPKKRRRPPATK